MRKFAVAGLIPAAFLLTAGGYFVTPSWNKILPAEDKLVPGTELTVRKGEIFYRRPLGRSLTATLGGELAVTVGGRSATLPAGSPLEVVRNISIEHGAPPLGGSSRKFCAPAESESKDRVPQFCVFDSDGDGLVDRAFLAGVRRKAGLEPVAIRPTPVSVASDVPLPGESEARLRFAGDLRFDLELVEEGRRLSYSNGRSVLKKSRLPADVNFFGASFTVLSYDSSTDQARIRWNSGFPEGEYSITTTTASPTTHVYVPR
jgi:hypothetical protein